MSALLDLAKHVENLGDITCPLCGETGFDVPGFVFSHEHFCEVRSACINALANRNSEISEALRARAASEASQ